MFDLVVTVDRYVRDTYKVRIEADTEGEAEDIAYQYFTAEPGEEVIFPDWLLKTDTETLDTIGVGFETELVPENDDEEDSIA